ncbi:MAG TPA: nuclear transport factor 2 family protein [Baekduia sp.]|uniref:nuclear transport factor 2 family protein n=1 Tax=Baekduia sp. TaxID=2600305 RepID=UPI002D78F420|nr:nuclear transport factor 2 family protein [Baekduia sp.]HET6509955.1 nuclear transport factor 2 family protein [Baekduia sp.]
MTSPETEIRAVLARYGMTLDRRDWPGLRACFHAGATVDYGRLVQGTVDDLLAYLAAETATLEQTMHLLSTCVIDPDGDDAAAAETYCVAEHRGPAEHAWCRGQVTAWVRYLDRFERRGGTWAIARRRAVVEWTRGG